MNAKTCQDNAKAWHCEESPSPPHSVAWEPAFAHTSDSCAQFAHAAFRTRRFQSPAIGVRTRSPSCHRLPCESPAIACHRLQADLDRLPPCLAWLACLHAKLGFCSALPMPQLLLGQRANWPQYPVFPVDITHEASQAFRQAKTACSACQAAWLASSCSTPMIHGQYHHLGTDTAPSNVLWSGAE